MNAEEYNMINDLGFNNVYVDSKNIKQILIDKNKVIIFRDIYMTEYELDEHGIKITKIIIDLLKNIRPDIKIIKN
ncbi:hypothetical protein [Clostridium perfringens]|uniref:hypothetical protein n=1 Tax=Clostridium perfringens TaxID=1502 RepID=UPI0013E2A98F|nr:hypothetical protein [Clostridium perfringens]MDK0660202.1 hypothetical protein [Clostridium perfringens]NGT58952.1 hypothetical protein [Clostridium perfringens]UBK33310.1 hypothetical protein KLF45_15075 [Clostridium perfringens]UBL03736.1 hypothetical protein KLF24_15415 [Clostridium perfringens]HAT4331030.1 hypothetical protein [Clostridium perfringens]